MKRKAFTLIELLVVIAVIAVLMGILMPSLRMAREQARSIVCSSNLKTLVLGYTLYAGDNNGKLVNGHCHVSGFDPKNPTGLRFHRTGKVQLWKKRSSISNRGHSGNMSTMRRCIGVLRI